MCTLAVAWGVHRHFPLLVAANRDEFLSRAATPPVVHDPVRGVVGGRDVEKGGTWVAVRRDGFFCGLTNRRPVTPPKPDARSRGHVVLSLMQAESPTDAAARAAALDPAEYNGFNLLFGDATALFTATVWPDAGAAQVAPVSPGVHVLPTSKLDAPDQPKVRRLHARLAEPLPEDWPGVRAHLHAALGDHTLPPAEAVAAGAGAMFDTETLRQLDAVCVHLPHYGTRSSTLLALAPGVVLHAEHAEGPACRSAFVSFADLLGAGP